jgi:hypothetical protein
LSLFFEPARVFSAFGLVQVLRLILVRALFLREIVKKPADAGIARPGGRPFVKQPCLLLYGTGLVAGCFQAQRTCEPYGAAFDEPPHVLAPDQRNVFAKFLLIEVLQPLTVAGFLLAHLFKSRRGIGKITAEFLSEVGVDALVLFLQRNGQGEELLLRQLIEVSHHVQFLIESGLVSKAAAQHES